MIPIAQQVQQFATAQGNIPQLLGQNKSAINIGSNDIFNHHRYNKTTVTQLELMAAIQANYTDQLLVNIDPILLLLGTIFPCLRKT